MRQHKHDTLVCSRHVQIYVGSAIKAKILKYCSRKQKESKTHEICIKEVGHDKKKYEGCFGREEGLDGIFYSNRILRHVLSENMDAEADLIETT